MQQSDTSILQRLRQQPQQRGSGMLDRIMQMQELKAAQQTGQINDIALRQAQQGEQDQMAARQRAGQIQQIHASNMPMPQKIKALRQLDPASADTYEKQENERGTAALKMASSVGTMLKGITDPDVRVAVIQSSAKWAEIIGRPEVAKLFQEMDGSDADVDSLIGLTTDAEKNLQRILDERKQKTEEEKVVVSREALDKPASMADFRAWIQEPAQQQPGADRSQAAFNRQMTQAKHIPTPGVHEPFSPEVQRQKAEIAQAGRTPGAAEPLVAIMGPDGKPVLVRRSEAEGKSPASTREQGRQVTSTDAGEFTAMHSSLDDLNDLRAAVKDGGSTGAMAQLGQLVPNFVTEATGFGTEAKVRQAVIAGVKQVIGKALEGGVLRKEDEHKYKEILPTIGDVKEVVQAKLDGLEKRISRARDTKMDDLEDAGYDVSKFRERRAVGTNPGPATGDLGKISTDELLKRLLQ